MNAPNVTKPKRQYALNIRSLLLILLVVAAADGTWTYSLWQGQKAQSLQSEQAKIVYQRNRAAFQNQLQAEATSAALAVCAQTEQLRQVRLLTNALGQLLSFSPGLSQLLTGLKTNH